MRKIDIYLEGKYFCSTVQCSTLKEAIEKFIESHPTNIKRVQAAFNK